MEGLQVIDLKTIVSKNKGPQASKIPQKPSGTSRRMSTFNVQSFFETYEANSTEQPHNNDIDEEYE